MIFLQISVSLLTGVDQEISKVSQSGLKSQLLSHFKYLTKKTCFKKLCQTKL